MTALISKLTKIAPHELKDALISFLFIFMLMASYQIMKPVRDALPSDWGDIALPMQWTFTFIVSTIAVSVYNFLGSKFSPKTLVPAVFIFFASTFTVIFAAFKLGAAPSLLGKIFYVWSSVFSLFHISVFWSFLSQKYTKEESKRLFGFINIGASAGAIAGPLLIIQFASNLSVENILIITAVTLVLTLPLIKLLNRSSNSTNQSGIGKVSLNTNPFSGFQELISHNKLKGIAAFIFFLTGVSAFLYYIQTVLLEDYTRIERKELLGSVELITNTLTILIGIFATNRITQKFGLSTSLGIIPLLVAVLIVALSLHPAIMLVLALQVVRRAGNYAVTRPSREILYTAVSSEARFKTKPIIDVAIYRGGDVFWIWLITLTGEYLFELTLPQYLFFGASVALITGLIGIHLGKKHDAAEMAEDQQAS